MGAGAGAIRAGRAFVELFSEDGPLKRGLAKTGATMRSWAGKMSSVGTSAFSVKALAVDAGLIGAAKLFADMGSELNDMSGRTGASVESLSTLGFAAKQSGADMGALEVAMKKGQKTIAAAAGGSKESAAALAELGLSADELINLSPDEQFRKIGKAIGGIQNPTKKTAAALAIFGKSGTALLPMIDEMQELEDRARELGLEMSTSDAKAADSLGDKMGELWDVVKMGAFTVGSALAPAMEQVIDVGTRMIVFTTNWLRENKGLVVAVAAVSFGITAFSATMIGLGTVLGAGATVLGTVSAVLGFILSPIGLAIAAVAALGYAFFKYTDMGRQAIEWLGEKFAELKADALETFQGISDALSAGDVSLAAKILWLTLQMEWAKGTQGLKDKWTEFKTATAKVFTDIATLIKGAFVMAVAEAQKAMNRLDALMAKLALRVVAAQKGMEVPALAYSLIDVGVAGANAAVDAQAKSDALATNQAGEDSKGELDSMAEQEKEARAAELERLKKERSDAIATAASNKVEGTGRNKSHYETMEEGKTSAAQAANVDASDVRSKEGLKSVVSALNSDGARVAQQQLKALQQLAENDKRRMQWDRDNHENLEATETVA